MKHKYSWKDGVTLTYGDIRQVGYEEVLPVYFERPDGRGDFDFAEGITPACTFQRTRGFSEMELAELSSFLRDNMFLLWEDARELSRSSSQEEEARP